MVHTINIGGLVAIGFSEDMKYMIVVGHSGTGIFNTNDWTKIARDSKANYPENSMVNGIGHLAGVKIKVEERDYLSEIFEGFSVDKLIKYKYNDGVLEVQRCA